MDLTVMEGVVLGVVVLGLLVCSAFLSASETAFVSTSRPRLHAQARKGNKRAQSIQRLIDDMGQLVGSILLCNTLVTILATSLATALFTTLFGEVGVAYATFAMTVLIVIYAEMLPKLLAINKADQVSRVMEPFITWMLRLVSPLTILIERIAKATLRFMNIKIDPETHLTSSLEELRGAIDLLPCVSHAHTEERAMLHSILDLAEVDVDEIMVHRQSVAMIDATLPPQEILDRLIQSPYTRVPLWQGNPDNIIGVLNAKDFLRSVQAQGGDIKTADVMKAVLKPWFVPDTTTLREQLQAFRQKKEHFALVVDEYGTFLGVVTLEDIMEEIVGEIVDEHDVPLPGVWSAKNGDLFVTGKTTIRDLNRQYAWDLPDEDAATLAGFLIHETRTIPKRGQVFMVRGFRIKVARRVRNQLTLLRVRVPENHLRR